jgi:hypothetical protein
MKYLLMIDYFKGEADMPGEGSFYETTNKAGNGIRRVGHGLAIAFNWVSGNKSLRKRDLSRGPITFPIVLGGAMLSATAMTAVGMIIAPAAAAAITCTCVWGAAVLGGIGVSRLQAAYLVSKDKSEQKRSQTPRIG